MQVAIATPAVARDREAILARLRSRVVSQIHREALRTGDRLPSMRDLADEWGVNPRFVRAAYETLEREGLVELRPRSGVYVAVSLAGTNEGNQQIARWLVETLRRGRTMGIPPIECHQRVRQALEGRTVRAACVESNDDQISWLVHESRTDYGLDAFGIDLDSVDRAELAGRIRGSDVVISTAFHGELLETVARAEGKPIVLLRLAGDFVEPLLQALRRARLYFVVADRRFAERLPVIYGGVEGAGNLLPLVAGEDDLSAIPPGAAVYVTHAAERRMSSAVALRTVWSPGRIFADSMATELLHVIVRSNLAAMRGGSQKVAANAYAATF